MNQRVKHQQHQQQALMQQALMQQQQLYHSGVLAAISQMEPVPSGNLPPGFDPSTCRSVFVGNIHPQVTEALLAEVFQSMGPLEGCKLIRKEKIQQRYKAATGYLPSIFEGSSPGAAKFGYLKIRRRQLPRA